MASGQCLLTPPRVTFDSGGSAAAPGTAAGHLSWGLIPASPEGRAARRGGHNTESGREQATGRRAELAPLLPAPVTAAVPRGRRARGIPERTAAGVPAGENRGGLRESSRHGGRAEEPARGRPRPRCRCSDPQGPSTGSRLQNRRGTAIPMGWGVGGLGRPLRLLHSELPNEHTGTRSRAHAAGSPAASQGSYAGQL